MPCFRIEFYGLVQGVGFRALINSIARKLGLKGEVWNDPENSDRVICYVYGTYEKIFNFLSIVFVNQSDFGPRIDYMKIYSTDCSYDDFSISYK